MKYNTRLIRSRRSYTIKEIANLFNVSTRTCFRWTKEGLKPIELNTNPLLFIGEDLIKFIKNNQEARRVKLKSDEYYCLKCKKAVKGKVGSEKTIKTHKKIGRENKDQYKKIAKCGLCQAKLNRFLSVYQKD